MVLQVRLKPPRNQWSKAMIFSPPPIWFCQLPLTSQLTPIILQLPTWEGEGQHMLTVRHMKTYQTFFFFIQTAATHGSVARLEASAFCPLPHTRLVLHAVPPSLLPWLQTTDGCGFGGNAFLLHHHGAGQGLSNFTTPLKLVRTVRFWKALCDCCLSDCTNTIPAVSHVTL